MTNQLPPVPPYSTTPAVPNFGTRLARASWLAPLVALLLVVITFRLSYDPVILHGVEVGLVTLIGGGVLWIAGLVSGVVDVYKRQGGFWAKVTEENAVMSKLIRER